MIESADNSATMLTISSLWLKDKHNDHNRSTWLLNHWHGNSIKRQTYVHPSSFDANISLVKRGSSGKAAICWPTSVKTGFSVDWIPPSKWSSLMAPSMSYGIDYFQSTTYTIQSNVHISGNLTSVGGLSIKSKFSGSWTPKARSWRTTVVKLQPRILTNTLNIMDFAFWLTNLTLNFRNWVWRHFLKILIK